MGPVTVGFGILLVVVGGIGFALNYQADKPPYTALIPAGFGLVLAILGLLARKDSLRKHVMHVAAMVGLVGAIGAAVMAVPKVLTMLSGGEVERPKAVIAQAAMAAICLVFVLVCVKSFVDARRRRQNSA